MNTERPPLSSNAVDKFSTSIKLHAIVYMLCQK